MPASRPQNAARAVYDKGKMVQSGDSPHDKEVSRPVDVEALVFPVGDASWRSALLRSTVAVSCAGAGLLLGSAIDANRNDTWHDSGTFAMTCRTR